MHLAQHGKLTLDSKKLKGTLEDFLQKENRFSALTRKNPEASAKLHHHLQVRACSMLAGQFVCARCCRVQWQQVNACTHGCRVRLPDLHPFR